jgi:hypothetical protein
MHQASLEQEVRATLAQEVPRIAADIRKEFDLPDYGLPEIDLRHLGDKLNGRYFSPSDSEAINGKPTLVLDVDVFAPYDDTSIASCLWERVRGGHSGNSSVARKCRAP